MQSLQDFPKSLSFADLAAEVPSFEDLRYSANRTFNAQMSSEYAPIRPTSYYSTPLELQSMPQMARNINLSQIPQEYVVSVDLLIFVCLTIIEKILTLPPIYLPNIFFVLDCFC